MAKKKISADTVSNPLADSLFFSSPQPTPEADPPTPSEVQVEQPKAQPPKKTQPVKSKSAPKPDKKRSAGSKSSGKAKAVKSGRVGRPRSARPTKRYSFEFFEDQIMDLRKLRANQELETGEATKLSHLVRAAIDDYINKQ